MTPASPAPADAAPAVPALPTPPVVAQVAAVAGERVGIVGANELGPAVPTMGSTPVVGTAGAELTPRLLISVEPNGIPTGAAPPGVVGEVDVGFDDEATLLEPEPHIPDIPDVSGIPGVVDIPDVADIPDNVDGRPVDIDPDDIDVDVPDVAAVAGAAVPAAVPPPSYVAVDPYIPDSEVPTVEHVVAIAPLAGIAIVPVTPPVGAGLTPGDVISVEPSGMPVGETGEGASMPSGEVAPTAAVGVSISSTCALAALQTTSAGRTAAINEILIGILCLKTASPRRVPTSVSFATISLGARLSDIDHPLGRGHEASG